MSSTPGGNGSDEDNGILIDQLRDGREQSFQGQGQGSSLGSADGLTLERIERVEIPIPGQYASPTVVTEPEPLIADAVTARHDAAPGQAESVIIAEPAAEYYNDPIAVERRFPYTNVAKQWGTGDVDGGLHLVAPMSR